MTPKSQHIKNKRIDNNAILASIYNLFIKEINFHVGTFFDSLKGILFVFEQNSKTDYKQSINYTALQLLMHEEKDVKNNILSSINSAFKYFQHADYDFFINENIHISNYQKVKFKSGEENETAIILQLINTSEKANDKSLHHLSNYFSDMAYGKTLNFNQIPISPFVIVNSLVNSIKDIDLNTGIRMIVYNTFEVNILLKLAPIYKKLVNSLANVIVHPTNNENNKFINNTIDKKYQFIQQMFDKFHHLKKHKKSHIKYISKDLLIQSLNIFHDKIQKKQQLDNNYVPNSRELKNILDKGIKKLSKSTVELNYKHSDSNTINLVSFIFQYISKDKSIPKVLKLMLIRIEIPVLKIALQDPDVFKYTKTPIRLLLNQMSYVPDGFSDNFDSSNKYIIKLQEIIAVIIVQSSYNKPLYQNLLSELNEFTTKTKKKFNLIQRRIKEKAIGLEKIASVKAHVAQLLETTMHDRYMPLYVRDLLLKTWKNVMVIEFLRHPEKSIACQSKIDFLELLLDYSRPIKNKPVTVNDVKKLALMFSEGLDLVAFNSKDLLDKNNELLNFLLQVHGLENSQENTESNEFSQQINEVILYVKKDNKNNTKKGLNLDSLDKYMDKTKALKVGTWLEFNSKKSKKYRAKISWISPITGKYLLVNSNGVRLADKTPNEISNCFRNKTCEELKTMPLIDRALLHIAKEMNAKIKA